MKKLTTALMLLALFVAPMTMAATTEPETVQDESQGLLLNGFWDNWYISLDGGISLFYSPEDGCVFDNFTQRIAPNVGLNFGKWWTPVFGTRIGLDYMSANSSTGLTTAFGYQDEVSYNNLYVQKHQGLRPHIDGMVDLVNLFGGYSKTRVYSLVIYGGFGYGYGWGSDFATGKWGTELRGGLINSFHVSDAVDVNIELKASKYDSNLTQEASNGNLNNLMASATVGIAYKFKQRGWEAPVIPVIVPVVPKYSDSEGDALVARLQEANNRIKDLENELAQANENVAKALANAGDDAPAYTIYYNINQSSINACNKKVVKAIAEAIKADPETKYVITGYADKETGTDAFNAKLREERAQSLYKMLVKCGVNPDQLSTTTDTAPLNKFNYVLDRAATIKIVK